MKVFSPHKEEVVVGEILPRLTLLQKGPGRIPSIGEVIVQYFTTLHNTALQYTKLYTALPGVRWQVWRREKIPSQFSKHFTTLHYTTLQYTIHHYNTIH